MSDPATPTPRTTGGNVRWEPPSPAELQEQMPGYTIEKLLGRGGMGAVYKGVQSNLDRTVAIKILPPGVEQEDPSFAERFKNEARLMARLNNPAVVSVHDFGLTTGGLLYFAMEYVDGTDVSQMIRSQGKLPPEHALAITAHVCDALSAAHELGIVHRDIKPANVLINMKGQVKVADFGLAKIEEPGTHGLTKTGYAMGTPDFVAPEVLMLGSHIDGRADLYAVGVMLYQMLTGEVPRGAFKPATARLPGLDPRFDPIILKAMQSDREERYQSSTELRRDLDVILTVPLVRQDEPPTSAIPAAQVAQTPAQRSAVQKRSADAPVRSASKAGEGTRAPLPPKKSSTPLLLGLGAAAAIGIGAFVMLGGGEKAQQSGPLSPLSGTSVAPAPKAAQGTERSTTPPPVKVSEPPKPAVQVPTWLQEARKRGGKLRFFASGKAQALIEKGETENFDDFIEVAASSHGWIARRANGETHVVGWVPESWPAGTPIKPTTVSRITRGHQFALCSARDGSFLSIHNIINGQIQGGKLAHKDSAAILNVHGHMVSLAADGKVLLQSATLPDSKHPPESFFRGSHGLTATVKHYIVAKPSAPPSSWNISGGFLRTFPSEITNVVELDAAGEQVICLTATGQVKVTNPEGSPLPASRSNLNPPTGLATAITVRAGNGMCAAQKTDGTWLAWGSSKELVEQVQKIGVALDLDLHVAGTTPFMLWVEPTSVSMIADKKPSAPTPAAAKPSAPPPSATTSPLPSVPLPAPKQWIDATAAVKAAAGPHQEAVPGGWRATDLIPVATVSDAKPRNAVCRVQHRGPLFLSLRFTMGQGAYQGSLHSMGEAVVRFVDYADGKNTHVPLASGAVPAGFKRDDSHETMFAAQGDQLSLWIDGQLVARATDTRLTAGPTRLRVESGTIIEKVEYAELPDEAAVASSPSLPASSSPPLPASELDQRLAALGASFQAAVERDANAAFKAGIAALDKLYLTALDRSLATASKGGKLEEAIALREEKQRIEKGEGVPYEVDESTQAPGKVPDTLKTLRKTYRSTTAQHEATKAKAMQPLYDKYDQALAAVQTELTQAQKLDDAMRVKTVREQIAATRVGAAAPPAAANGPASTSQPSTALAGASAPPSASTLLATKDKPFTNSLGMKFVPVPGTDILMCMHETRYKDYAAHAAETKVADRKWMEQTYKGFAITERKEEHPVANVSWDDAQAFCAWLSQKEGRVFRLPTDREWSMAVGIGRDEQWRADTTPATVFKNRVEYPWGDRWPPPKGSGNFADESCQQKGLIYDGFIAGFDDGFPATSPVMAFKPNKLGIHDMGGNVLEWCEDWHDSSKVKRVSRGGSWLNAINTMLMSSFRFPYQPELRDPIVGFRVVVETRAPASPSGAAVKPGTPTPTPPVAPATAPATAAKSDFTNSLGMQFVKVTGTKVLFCIHETRYKDYAAYATAVPTVNPRWKNQNLKGIAPKDRTDDHPVVIVSWEDAQAFCAWLSQKEGKRYRLPTDEEWSYAAGIGRDEKRKKGDTPGTLALVPNEYPWGAQWPPSKGCENYGDESYKAAIGEARYLTGYDDGYPTTAPVMSFKPNRYGLYDMGGNVLEWCEDWYNTTQTSRALRGSSWKGGAYDSELRLSHRGQATPDTREDNYGFRIVLESNE